jgi:hypothetical protein
MRMYPIWNKVTACIYKGDKSYGVKRVGEVSVLVGTSASNSHHFIDHKVTHRLMDNGDRIYRFYINDKLIKESILRKGSSELENEWFESLSNV